MTKGITTYNEIKIPNTVVDLDKDITMVTKRPVGDFSIQPPLVEAASIYVPVPSETKVNEELFNNDIPANDNSTNDAIAVISTPTTSTGNNWKYWVWILIAAVVLYILIKKK